MRPVTMKTMGWVLCALLCVGCSASSRTACERYEAMLPMWGCTDPEAWNPEGTTCPSDATIASREGARDLGLATLADCVAWMEARCSPDFEPGCSECITDSSCQCGVGLGAARFACSNRE